jgi:hypothetical protein
VAGATKRWSPAATDEAKLPNGFKPFRRPVSTLSNIIRLGVRMRPLFRAGAIVLHIPHNRVCMHNESTDRCGVGRHAVPVFEIS